MKVSPKQTWAFRQPRTNRQNYVDAFSSSFKSKALNEDLHALGNLHMDCMTKAQDFEILVWKSKPAKPKSLTIQHMPVVDDDVETHVVGDGGRC